MTDLDMSRRGNGNIISRLWRGEVSLPITYWVFGSIIGVALKLITPAILYVVFANSGSLSSFDVMAIIYVWQGILIAYSIFIFVAIWRSASRYTREHPTRWWGKAAQVMVFLAALSVVASLAQRVTSTGDFSKTAKNPSSDLKLQTDAMVAGLNRDLPKMIDQITRLDKIDYNPLGFTYYETITVPVDDIPGFVTRMKAYLSKNLCKVDSNTVSLLKNDGMSFKYLYFDNNKKNFGQVIVISSDCKA